MGSLRTFSTTVLAVALVAAASASTHVNARPYTSVTLADGGDYVISVTAPKYAAPGPWRRTVRGDLPRLRPGQWVQVMVDGTEGWRNTMLKVGREGKPLATRHNDRSHRLDAPWYANGKYRDGWYRVWPSAPPGHPYAESNELDTKALLTVRTNGSKVRFVGRNAPAEGLQLYGDRNQLSVDLVGGPKAWLQTDCAEVRVWGNRNRLSGTVKTEMVAVRVNGDENELRDMELTGLEVGNDVGLVVFPGRGFDGNKAVNVTTVCPVRRYPVTWVHTGFYLDDKASRNVIQGSRAKGFQSGAFVHGGSDNRIDLTAESCQVPVKISPHFTTPRVAPHNPAPTVRVLGTVASDRRVASLGKG
jgi:hypothetical protein